jgi:hypothetical protein
MFQILLNSNSLPSYICGLWEGLGASSIDAKTLGSSKESKMTVQGQK